MTNIDPLYGKVVLKNTDEKEFHQAVKEVLDSLKHAFEKHLEFAKFKILERIVEPERQFMFRVPWMDNEGEIHVNRRFRFPK